MHARIGPALALIIAAPATVAAADLPSSPPPRYVDRGAAVVAQTCPLWQPPYGIRIVPTNDVCDPTYVGSSMGLSRPSYYGTLPPPGYDAP
jgi:hypothetical protein